MCSSLLFGLGGSQTLACQLTTTFTSARSPSIVDSTLLTVWTSSKNRRVTFSYHPVNSAWPRVGPSGQSISLPSSSIIPCSSPTGAWTSSALYQSSASLVISVSVSGVVTVLTRSSSCLRSRMGSPGAGDGAPVRGVLVMARDLLVQDQVDQVRTRLGERLGDRRPDLARRLDARRGHAHRARHRREVELGVAEVEGAGEV